MVAHRSRDLLRRCLDALRRHPPPVPMHVIVVDNDSRDGTAAMVRAEHPEVELVEPGRNLGFAAATNLGLARGSAAYALALNPDTEVTAGCLDTVLAVLEEHPSVAAVGCRLERPDGTFDHASRRSFPTIVGALAHFTGIGRRERAPRAFAQYRAPWVATGPVDAVNGAFMLLRRRALDEVGRFDEGYWMYMEDLDLCFRLARAGWTTWYEPGAVALHVKHGSAGAVRSPRLEWAFHCGMLRFYRKHYAPERSTMVNTAVYTGIAVKLAAALVGGRVRSLASAIRR